MHTAAARECSAGRNITWQPGIVVGTSMDRITETILALENSSLSY
jgi:hypothetical protein